MKKTVVAKLCMASMALASLSLTSCMEKDLFTPNNETPSLATFATTQDVQFTMQYDVPSGYAAEFDVYAENPVESADNGFIVLRTDIKPIAAGIVESGSFKMNKEIPGYVKELYAFSSDLFAPRLLYAKIENKTANFRAIALPSSDETKAITRTTGTGKIEVEEGDFVPEFVGRFAPASEGNANVNEKVVTAIKKAFPEGWALTEPKRAILGNYIKEATMELKESAELWIAPMITGCSMTNTLGYFCYDGPKSDLTGKNVADLDEKLIIVFPFGSLSDNSFFKEEKDQTDIVRGDKFRLKYYDKKKKELVNEFPAGTTIVWFLWSGAYDRGTQTWKKSAQHKLYSHWDWNTCETEEAYRPHTAYYSIRHENTDYVCFSFEDQLQKSSDRDFNDMVFLMQANPSTALVPPVIIDDNGDPITHTENPYGILAFEDNWPWAGDYDLNDVVVKYNSEITYTKETNTNVYVSKTDDVFTLIHSGASYHNRFAIKYDIAPSNVKSIKINGTAVTPRADGTGYIIDVCPDVLGKIEAYTLDQSYAYNIVTEFQPNAIGQEEFQKKKAPYNPFISPKEGLEIHLPMYAPTSEADTKYFRTIDDCSRPEEGKYYIAEEGSQYPWGIHLSGVENFTIPTERVSIEDKYPRYTDWVKSNFTSYLDWYIK